MSDSTPSSGETSIGKISVRPENTPSLYQLAIAPPGELQNEKTMLSIPTPLLPLNELPLGTDKSVAEQAIRQLSREIEVAKEELHDLKATLAREVSGPSTRTWLLPLMAIGLALSLYGSLMSSTPAELVATGLMLLWSLAAFWLVYTQDKRLETSKDANQAEIEIWTKRIEELQHSLAQNQRIAGIHTMDDDHATNKS